MNRNKIQLKNVMSSSVFKALGIVLNLLLVTTLISLLGDKEYGIWVTVFAIVNWVFTFDLGFGLGLRNKLTEALVKKDMEEATLLISSSYYAMSFIAFAILLLGISIIIYIDISELLNYNDKSELFLKAFVIVALFFTVFNFVLSLYKKFFQAIHKVYLVELFSSVQVLFFVLFAYFIDYNYYSLIWLIVAYGFISVITASIATFTFFKKIKSIKISFKKKSLTVIKSILNTGSVFFLIQISLLVILSTDNIIIVKMIGPEAVTNYSIVQRIFQLIIIGFSLILAPSWSLYSDALIKKDFQWIKNNITKLIYMYALLLLLGIILLFSYEIIIGFWIGKEISIPLHLGLYNYIYAMLFSFANIFMFFINATGRLKLQTILYVFGAIVNIPLSIFFVHVTGNSTGVIIASIISIMPLAIFMPFQSYKILKEYNA